jgi:hypothetical protein
MPPVGFGRTAAPIIKIINHAQPCSEAEEAELGGVKLAYYAIATLSLDNRGLHQYSRSGLRWGLCWRGCALMAGRNIWYGYGEIDSDPKNPSPTVSVDLAKTSRV